MWAILTTTTTTTLCCLPLGMVGDNLTPGTTSGTEPDSFRDTLS